MEVLQKELMKIIESSGKKTLLLHSCCAPCSSYVLEYLCAHFDITIFFYNPNIIPSAEYNSRLGELEKLLAQMPSGGSVSLIKGEYDPSVFLNAIKGLENEPEGGSRCEVCFSLRLEETAKLAKELKSDFFTTTLSISPYKNARLLDYISLKLADKYGVKRLPSNFKKKGGYQRSIELSGKYNLYRQNWCGCPFSRAESERKTSE